MAKESSISSLKTAIPGLKGGYQSDVPIRSGKFSENKTGFYNYLYHGYPGFRNQPARVEYLMKNGPDHEQKKERMDIISSLTEEDFKSFAKEYLSGRPVVWCVVGNSKKTDMKALESFGKVEILKPSDVIMYRMRKVPRCTVRLFC